MTDHILDPNGIRKRPLSSTELANLKQATIDETFTEMDPGFTCDSCRHRPICVYVYDAYNTNGDCLAEK
jgi:hypothetical protein